MGVRGEWEDERSGRERRSEGGLEKVFHSGLTCLSQEKFCGNLSLSLLQSFSGIGPAHENLA